MVVSRAMVRLPQTAGMAMERRAWSGEGVGYRFGGGIRVIVGSGADEGILWS